MKKIFSLIMVMLLAAALTACGGSGTSGNEESDEGQNPVMNYVGFYVCDRANIFIEATDSENGASALVTWGSSASENSTWTMSGTFDAEEGRFEYHDCVRTDFVYQENGEIESQADVYTGGHGFMFFKDGEDGVTTLTWQDDQEHVADDMVFEYAGAKAAADSEAMTGMPNPWHTVESLAAAAEGAGLDGFTVPEGSSISLGELKAESYSYMDGLAEIRVPVAAVDMTIRKGLSSAAAEEGAVSGDYGDYKNSWTQDINGVEVKCFGNREGESTKTIWTVGDYCYSITAFGAGGDDDFGLNAEDLNALVSGIK